MLPVLLDQNVKVINTTAHELAHGPDLLQLANLAGEV